MSETIVFYTSDHGQNLLDRGIQTHCNTVEPHPFEGFVPAAVLTDIPSLKFEYDVALLAFNIGLTNIGQFTKKELSQLEKFVNIGLLVKTKNHLFPNSPTKYIATMMVQ